jgi:hypothetical protein
MFPLHHHSFHIVSQQARGHAAEIVEGHQAVQPGSRGAQTTLTESPFVDILIRAWDLPVAGTGR